MKLLQYILSLLVIWYMIAALTCSIRHPWMTEMEIVQHFPKVLMFSKFNYKQTRQDYEN